MCGRLKADAQAAQHAPTAPVFGSDVAHRMVDFAQRNAQRAGVGEVVQLRGGDALQRMPPSEVPGVMLLNPPYGERIGGRRGGCAKPGPLWRPRKRADRRRRRILQPAGHALEEKLPRLDAWLLTPDLKLPSKMRLKESRRVPMWNGPIECRLFRFDMIRGSARDKPVAAKYWS
jgi:putative N6-adenine-specific DNA methylase